ncbi:MAG: hypothetical protein H0V17_31475 [Deltaproteobacteria bacterium]|nr:hypothetical protein [Deltaproteobacteria bacterium]
MLACLAVSAVLATGEGASIAPYVAGAGALVYFIATIAAMIPQTVTFEIAGTTVTPSWRGPISGASIEVGSWVAPGVDASIGLAVYVRGAGGTLRIGLDGHDGEGYAMRGKPTRVVDCTLPKTEAADLLAAFGIERGPAGPLAIPLLRSTQSFGGVARGMAPWLISITLLGVFGIVVGNTEWGEQMLKSPHGQLVMVIVCGGLALAGVVMMIVRGRRVKTPELELRFDDDALRITDVRRGTATQVPWSSVTIEKLKYSVSSRMGTFSMPLMVLGLGDRTLRIGAWDTGLAWPGAPASTWRAPHWLVGAAKWPKLVDALKRHNRM